MIDPAERLGPGLNSLELWADLYRRGALRRVLPLGNWQTADELVRVAEVAGIEASDHLANLLRISDQTLDPLAEPLAVDFGAHRWLFRGREETYSDRLQWIPKQIADAPGILKLFGVQDEKLLLECATVKPTIKREQPIDDGRPDLVIKFGENRAETV
jgi:hypothetical protein